MSRKQHRIDPTTQRRRFDTPLTIGVIADTHIYPGSRRQIPDQVIDLFVRARVELMVHLGDANSRVVLDDMGSIAPLIAVFGNNDDDELTVILPERTRFEVGTHSFGVLHGHGGKSARQLAIEVFTGKVDCVLFGHSHKPLIEKTGDLVLVNPGSATDRRWHEHFGVAIITVTETRIEPELVLYASPEHLVNVSFA